MQQLDNQDRVDLILRQWRHERPDIDPRPMEVLGRIMRIARNLDRYLAPPYKAAGLDFGLFDVLATLRRHGSPFAMSPGELNDWCMLTSGGMTSRLDRLEATGLVRRLPDPEDRRSLLIELTPQGLALIDDLIVEHLENEQRLLEELSPTECDTLSGLLRSILVRLEEGI